MGQVRRPCVILLGLEKNPDSGPASSWWEGKEDLTRPGVVTSTGTSQLPSRGGRGCDWTRPGGYSYRYCSASSVWRGGGGVDWTKQRCVFTVELFRDCSPVQQPDKSTFPELFRIFRSLFQFFQELFQDFIVQLLDRNSVMFSPFKFQRLFKCSVEGEDDRTRAARFFTI